ncbi:phosphoribosylanthranilate isomerase [Aidingimonas halophila]|uniref:N-(5'-phosphoribosyl)anthranilate isomerase n=1 Tax=Aidingimonas halophila TaxID=574349 RepID=A0A1H3DFD1_9GAMM|nr:phosphoribosylanthranilate isomerase [Aidingimonas halophila]GHC29978.1 N-(5'-phosphoribosyl)anthranilate isomerase [Aidingimonas halophila]SDX65081.1 phosphoribosylanthranilate isomerase [Aidingimonas halophila]
MNETSPPLRRTRVKICGITREEDLQVAVAAGADALGFVLWPGSQRAIGLERLAELSAQVPAFVTRVGLFVDQEPALIQQAGRYLDLLQFHGNEAPDDCRGFARPWIKALRMREDIDVTQAASRYADASALLLDAYRPGVPGGTGETFDWSRIPASLTKPVILAGGLTPQNVGEAIRTVHPFAVDVSGGVEHGPGIKDADRINEFIDQVCFSHSQ